MTWDGAEAMLWQDVDLERRLRREDLHSIEPLAPMPVPARDPEAGRALYRPLTASSMRDASE